MKLTYISAGKKWHYLKWRSQLEKKLKNSLGGEYKKINFTSSCKNYD